MEKKHHQRLRHKRTEDVLAQLKEEIGDHPSLT